MFIRDVSKIMNSNEIGRTSKTCCAVEGCTNTYANTARDIKFYSFPRRWYETERKNIWIKRIKGHSLWEPKIHSKICSAHFIGNNKSNNPLSPSYNPTIFPNGNMDTSQVESAENRDYNSDSETDTADETEDIDEKLLGQFDFVDVKESDVDYPSNSYLPEDVSALDVKQEPIDESLNEGEFSIKLEPCDLTEYEEKPDLFMLSNYEYLKNEHDYCRSNDMENDEKDVDFWRKEVKKLRQEIFRRNREIRIAKDEIESMRNQIAMNNEILKEYLTQQKCKESIGLTN